MPYQIDQSRSKRKTRKPIDISQNKFPGAYQSTIDNSRRRQDSLSDMTNIELVQDSLGRPRPPLVRYGEQPPLPVIGRGEYRWDGMRGLIWLLDDGGDGILYRQEDGGTFTVLVTGITYDITNWCGFAQSKGRVYPYNSVDNLTYIDLTDWSVHDYTALATPSAGLSATYTGTAGAFTHYYRVSANNEVGESIASAVFSNNAAKIRDAWIENTDYIDLAWTDVAGATSYTVYYGDTATTTNELVTVTDNSYKDLGTLAVNPFKLAPEGNSTEGFIPAWLYNDSKNAQVFGVEAETNKLYYSAPGTGDFSPYNGGGWVAIDEDGDTELNFVDGFRNGKGDPVLTCSSRGAAGKGILSHVTFEDLTIGDQIITYPNVYPASGLSGTYAPRATVKARDALYYFTGQDVRSTGTSQNIVNILTTNTISQVIEPDIDNITLGALHDAVGVEYKDRLYFALPVGANSNNEIWYLDLSRKNAWVLRWPVAAKDLWLYEDNDGATHFCALVDDVILEFTRTGSQPHQDDNVAWRSRLAFESLVWDENGINLGNIRNQYFKFLNPKGTITVNATGLSRTGITQAAGSDSYTVTTSYTGIGQWDYSGDYMYGDDPGVVNTFGKSVTVLEVRPKGLLAQEAWEVVCDTAGSDYILSSVVTRGWYSDQLIINI